MMGQNNRTRLKVLTGGHHRLEVLHDRVMSLLDTHEKQGIRLLLKRNSESCKKLIFPLVKASENRAALMTALAGILEAHARECYTIGYLDCAVNGNFDSPDKADPNP